MAVPQELRHINAIPTASSPNGINLESDRDWIGAVQSMATVVGASKMPANTPEISCATASGLSD